MHFSLTSLTDHEPSLPVYCSTLLTAFNLNDVVFLLALLLNDVTGSETASHAPLPDASSRSHSVTSHISHVCKLWPRSRCC